MNEEKTDIYIYSHFVNIGPTQSHRANMIMIEKQDIFDMFDESTISEIEEYEKSGMSINDFFPLDGIEFEEDVHYVLFRL